MDAGHSFDLALLDDEPDAPPAPSGLGLDPRTGLASDFLNQFAEAVALLDLLAKGDDLVLDDLIEWRPRSYADHFAQSRFPDAGRVLDAWRAAPPLTRRRLEAESDEFGAVVTAAAAFLDACRNHGSTAAVAAVAAALAHEASRRLDRLDALVHAGRTRPSHAAVSALFARRLA